MWRRIQSLLLLVVQTVTEHLQVKGVPRILYALRILFLQPDETYEVYKRISLKIDNSSLSTYQFLNVVNYGGFELVLILERLLRKGDVYVDVGANIGYMALNAARRIGSAGCTLAVEPEPRVREKLLHNVWLNRAENVVVVAKALGDHEGIASFDVATEEGLSRLDHGRGPNPCMVLQEQISVPITTLDALVEEVCPSRPIRLVKIDVEGFELSVLMGATRLLGRSETIIVLECNPGALAQNDHSLVDIHAFLTRARYEVFAIRSHTADWLRIGRFPSFVHIENPVDYSDEYMDAIAVPSSLLDSLATECLINLHE